MVGRETHFIETIKVLKSVMTESGHWFESDMDMVTLIRLSGLKSG